jgi:hypothetical protein
MLSNYSARLTSGELVFIDPSGQQISNSVYTRAEIVLEANL